MKQLSFHEIKTLVIDFAIIAIFVTFILIWIIF